MDNHGYRSAQRHVSVGTGGGSLWRRLNSAHCRYGAGEIRLARLDPPNNILALVWELTPNSAGVWYAAGIVGWHIRHYRGVISVVRRINAGFTG